MLKDDTLGFVRYHALLCLHGVIGEQRIFQNVAYAQLFDWIASPGPATINFWCNGERFVNNNILEMTFASPDKAFEKYSEAWEYMLDHYDITCPDGLLTQLKDAISMDLINDNILYNKDNEIYENDFDILAVSLIEALTNDRARKRVTIDADIMNRLEQQDQRCRLSDLELKTPYVLYALMSEQNSVFFKLLEHIKTGLGKEIATKIEKYVNKKDHSGLYQGWPVSESKFLFYAKKYALKKGRNTAGEEEILRGLMLGESKTMLNIFSNHGGKEVFYKALDEYAVHITTDI